MTSNIKYVGMDVHKEHADSPIMPPLGPLPREILHFGAEQGKFAASSVLPTPL